MMLSAIAMGKMFMDTSIGSFMGIEKEGFLWMVYAQIGSIFNMVLCGCKYCICKNV